jgi:hypothetical protein
MSESLSRILYALVGAALIGVLVYNLLPRPEAGSDLQAEPSPERPERTTDGRLAIYLTPDEQDHISEEMIALLNGVQGLSAAIASEDRQLIEETAAELSGGTGSEAGRSVNRKLPQSFRQIGQALRQDFGRMATEADTAKFVDLHLDLSDAMGRCIACHGTYGIVEGPPNL